jgi:hypothetical protein
MPDSPLSAQTLPIPALTGAQPFPVSDKFIHTRSRYT